MNKTFKSKISVTIGQGIFNPYKEDEEEDLEYLMWELEQLNEQNQQAAQSHNDDCPF